MAGVHTHPWPSLLEGTLADRAHDVIEAIARDSRMRALDDTDASDPSLAAGAAGRALFYAYRAEARSGEDAELAVALLDEAVAGLERATLPPSLYAGFTGIAWVHAHLADWLFDADADASHEVDEALVRYLQQSPWTGDYDLISGLVGLGVYALEIWPRPGAREILRHVLARLTETAVRTEAGIAWFSTPARLGPIVAARAPGGCCNLGMAHGVPGVVALLGRMTSIGVDVDTVLTPAVTWLLEQRLPDASASAFASWVGPGLTPEPARMAWCYGDPGVAAGLLAAARGARRPDWEREAVGVVRRAATRSFESSGVRDAGLCHGAAGIAHIFNRMFHRTGLPESGEAARAWLARTLDLAVHDHGIAGFAAFNSTDGNAVAWDADRGFLTGAAGIGLALLGACTPVEPAWDRVLLTDVAGPCRTPMTALSS
jgi:lantibiotic modifying enzyme